MEQNLLISDAAKRVQVENHVLRYWEEELQLPIRRNEAGHRYYTEEDIERFMQIKTMKERGLQLKAIRMILKDGKLDMLPSEAGEGEISPAMLQTRRIEGMAINIVNKAEIEPVREESSDEKMKRLQRLLKQLFKESLQENSQEICRDIRDSVIKELDYQFRCQEERENEREKVREQRTEEYYKRMDELLRKKTGKIKPEKQVKATKKKRHLPF